MKPLRTPKQARADFESRGQSIAAWARTHNVGRAMVYAVLSGRKKGLRGSSHKIAVLLGIKAGVIEEPDSKADNS